MERDDIIPQNVIEKMNFNSHAHVERDDGSLRSQEDVLNFNSHAHVERDVGRIYRISAFCISTHTLTWSVTKWLHTLLWVC